MKHRWIHIIYQSGKWVHKTHRRLLKLIHGKRFCISTPSKAGAYAIQGQAGWMIERIEGDFYTVVGLPLNQVVKKLKEKQIIDLQNQ